MAKCTVCNKEFEAKRVSAKFCSSTCRSQFNRVSVAENVSVAPISVANATVTATIKPPVDTEKTAMMCGKDGCYLARMPGHDGLCIYHWRKLNGLDTISDITYAGLNKRG